MQAKYGNVRLVEGFKRARRQAALEWLEQVQVAAKEKGIRLKTEVLDGDSKVKVIIDYAKKNSVDLIVIGSTGLTGFKELIEDTQALMERLKRPKQLKGQPCHRSETSKKAVRKP